MKRRIAGFLRESGKGIEGQREQSDDLGHFSLPGCECRYAPPLKVYSQKLYRQGHEGRQGGEGILFGLLQDPHPRQWKLSNFN